jgi:hypothetical protein
MDVAMASWIPSPVFVMSARRSGSTQRSRGRYSNRWTEQSEILQYRSFVGDFLGYSIAWAMPIQVNSKTVSLSNNPKIPCVPMLVLVGTK